MATLILEDFKIGLDRRRMNETSLPGSLVVCENAHITRGGEVEKNEAFIRFCDLPANTFGLKAVNNGFMVFGSDNITPTILNSNPSVRYQRLNDTGNPNMLEVLWVELFDGKPYVVADYDDGIIRHWYDGVKVADMFSGKARARFSISANPDDVSAVSASGSFVIVSPADGCSISSILVDTVQLLSSTVTFDTDIDGDTSGTFESKVVDAINENSNISGFTAALEAGRKVVITAQIAGATVNGDVVSVVSAGSITIQNQTAMAGGVDAQEITDITVNAVSIMPTAVAWSDSNQATAAAVTVAINNYTATSGYEAFAFGSTVIVRRTADSATPNGHVFAVTADADIDIENASATMTGGSASATIVDPGRFIKTFKTKMYALSGPSIYYSEIGVPTNFNSGTGAGFDNLSTNASGAELLVAIANYFENMAIFSRNNVQVWFMSDDPNENSQLQVLNNTGTIAPASVVEFGDNDVFYLSESGIRSLRARDTTNAAFVNDVGIAIDTMIQQEILRNNLKAEKAVGILEPRQGRYLLVIGETIYAFSFFPSSKISAWSTYKPGFEIIGMDSVGQTVVCRSENALYKIGFATERVYDARKVKIITPFMSGEDPSSIKTFTGLDMSCQGTWDIYIATDPLRIDEDGQPDETLYEKIGTITGTTYAETGGENGHVGFDAISSHISLMFICRTDGYARIGNVAVHFADGGEKQ